MSDFVVRPIILGYGHTPDAAYSAAVDNAIHGANGVSHFYHAYGQSLEWREPYRTASFSTTLILEASGVAAFMLAEPCRR